MGTTFLSMQERRKRTSHRQTSAFLLLAVEVLENLTVFSFFDRDPGLTAGFIVNISMRFPLGSSHCPAHARTPCNAIFSRYKTDDVDEIYPQRLLATMQII